MRHSRRHFARFACKTLLLSLTLTALPLFGCGRSNEPAPSTDTPKTEGKKEAEKPAGGSFKVALVTPGSINDGGWSQGAYNALQQIGKETGAEIQNVEAAQDSAKETALRNYASKGFNMVIAHGGEFESLALKMEKEFPKTLFVVASGRQVGTNTTPVVLNLQEGAYLQGMLAAGMSKSGKIGSVGAQKSPAVQAVFDAYQAGAKAQNPKVTVVPTVYTLDWEDTPKAQTATFALIDQGVDVVIHDLDKAAAGVFKAVQERNKPDKPVWALATNSDQSAAAPDVILSSSTIDISKAYLAIAKAVKDGTFKPNDTPFGMKSGVIGYVWNPQLEAKVPADLKSKIEAAKQQILDGKLDVTKGTP